MFPFVSHTWNPMGGECEHNCVYCYVKRQLAKPVLAEKYSGEPRIVGNAWGKHGNDGKVIFVEDMGDLFANKVPAALAHLVADFAWKHPANTYLFLTKNPANLTNLVVPTPMGDPWPRLIFGTTVESDNWLSGCTAPKPTERVKALLEFKKFMAVTHPGHVCKFFLSFEPIIRFNNLIMRAMVGEMKPDFIAIGADSGGNNLPEPTFRDVVEFAEWVRDQGIKVYLKKNLARVVGQAWLESFERSG